MKVNRPKIKGIRGRPAVEPGDNAPARVETRCLDCGVLLEFFNDRWLAFAALGSRAICPKNLKPHRAAQPANTDDRQADTIPDDLEEIYNFARKMLDRNSSARSTVKLIERTGRAETRIEVLEAVVAKARCIRHWHDSGRNNEGMIVSAEAVRDLWASLERLDAALAAPSVSPEQGSVKTSTKGV